MLHRLLIYCLLRTPCCQLDATTQYQRIVRCPTTLWRIIFYSLKAIMLTSGCTSILSTFQFEKTSHFVYYDFPTNAMAGAAVMGGTSCDASSLASPRFQAATATVVKSDIDRLVARIVN